jgi:hypothetical protein
MLARGCYIRAEFPGKEPAMARVGTSILDSGEPLPALGMDTVAHGRLALPDAIGDGWGVLLFYRAHW